MKRRTRGRHRQNIEEDYSRISNGFKDFKILILYYILYYILLLHAHTHTASIESSVLFLTEYECAEIV